MKLVWLPGAIEDLQEIYDSLYERWGAKIANQFLELVNRTVSRLKSFPNSCPMVIGKESYRRALIHPNVSMYYKIHENFLFISSWQFNRQDPENLRVE